MKLLVLRMLLLFNTFFDWFRRRTLPLRRAIRAIFGIVSYMLWWTCQACALFAICLSFSTVMYCLLYWLWVPQPLFNFPVYFGYGASDSLELLGAPLYNPPVHRPQNDTLPVAHVDLRDDARGGWQRGVYASRQVSASQFFFHCTCK